MRLTILKNSLTLIKTNLTILIFNVRYTCFYIIMFIQNCSGKPLILFCDSFTEVGRKIIATEYS